MDKLISICPGLEGPLEDMREAARYLWERGWAEANGGNLSVDVGGWLPEDAPFAGFGEWQSLPQAYPELAGRYYLVSGSGRRFRDFARKPEENACILRIAPDGRAFRRQWGGCGDPAFRPTSELPSHLAMHRFLRQRGQAETVILHTHPTELIALSHLADFRDAESLSRALWATMPEIKVCAPGGVGWAAYACPGSEELARATVEAFGQSRQAVLWEMHGLVATGRDVMSAFDLIDVLNKAAKLVLLIKMTGGMHRGIREAELDELARAFGV